jgi:hypothetical protein
VTGDPFLQLALVGGAIDADDCARAARALISERLPDHPFDAAVRAKRILAARGFRDDATAFALPDMLERRAGNCLGLTLLVGAVLLDRGHEVDFVVRLDPLDDVHDAGQEYFARLHDPVRGVDSDSRLPEARDRAARYRFVPVEHASIMLPGAGGDRPFEATNLVDLEVPPGWAPAAESIRRVGFAQLASTVWCERAKALIRTNTDAATWRQALGFALRGLRGDPGNREAWTEVWQAARELGRPALAAVATARHADAGGDDSLFWFTRYRMIGDEACLDRALARLPAYAEAYLEKHVVLPTSRGVPDDALDDLRRRLVISAWLYATSEVLELESLYRRHAAHVAHAFSADELHAVLASFGETGRDGPSFSS